MDARPDDTLAEETGRPDAAGPQTGRWLFRGLGIVAALVLLSLMIVTFIDVIGRYVFSSPLPGAFELTELGMAVLIFAALPLVTADDGHITVDIATNLIPTRLRRPHSVLIRMVMAVGMGVVAWRLFDLAGQKAQWGDQTVFLHLPLAPIAYFMSAMAAFSTLLLVLAVGEALAAALRRR